MKTFNLLSLVVLFAFLSPAYAQQQVPPPPPPEAGTAGSAPSTPAPGTAHPKRTLPGFLILGTVFDDKAFSFQGVQVRVRRSTEKKYRWETYTNSRGEFAVRVPEGPIYEVVVRAKKFREQSQNVNSVNGDTQQRLSIRLEAASGQKTGANKP